MPNLTACCRMGLSPSCMPRFPNTVLQETVKAKRSGTLPFPVGLLPSLQAELSKLISSLVVPGSFRLVGAYTRVCGV